MATKVACIAKHGTAALDCGCPLTGRLVVEGPAAVRHACSLTHAIYLPRRIYAIAYEIHSLASFRIVDNREYYRDRRDLEYASL